MARLGRAQLGVGRGGSDMADLASRKNKNKKTEAGQMVACQQLQGMPGFGEDCLLACANMFQISAALGTQLSAPSTHIVECPLPQAQPQERPPHK